MIFGDLGSRMPRDRPGTMASAAASGVPTAPGGPPALPVPRSVLADMAHASWRVRGSSSTYTKSAARLAARTANVMMRKIPWSRG